jgi:hypothetical protein
MVIGAGMLVSGGVSASATTSTGTVQAMHSKAPECVMPEKPKSPGYDTATRNDKEFNRDFRHCFTTVDGVQMHYVIGGTGPQTLVMLHGWPESWYEFKGIMPSLLPGRTVIAVDLPGLGDSTGSPPNFAFSTLARYEHDLLDRIGKKHNVQLVGHDTGAGVAYPLAATYRDQFSGLQGFLSFLLPPVQDAAPGATGAEVADSGHWLLEETPQRVIDEINAFTPAH